MLDAIIMRPENIVIFLYSSGGPSHWRVDPETAPAGWEIRPDVELVKPPDLGKWPEGTESTMAILCVSETNEKLFRVFKSVREIDGSEFRETGLRYREQAASARLWADLLRAHDEMQARLAEPDEDPPGALDEVLESLREGR